MLGLKLNHISKSGPCYLLPVCLLEHSPIKIGFWNHYGLIVGASICIKVKRWGGNWYENFFHFLILYMKIINSILLIVCPRYSLKCSTKFWRLGNTYKCIWRCSGYRQQQGSDLKMVNEYIKCKHLWNCQILYWHCTFSVPFVVYFVTNTKVLSCSIMAAWVLATDVLCETIWWPPPKKTMAMTLLLAVGQVYDIKLDPILLWLWVKTHYFIYETHRISFYGFG